MKNKKIKNLDQGCKNIQVKWTLRACLSVNVFFYLIFFVFYSLAKSFIWNRFLNFIVFFLGAEPGGCKGLIDFRYLWLI
jgi:hypothetical protein